MLAYKNRFHGHGSLRYVMKNGQINRGRFFVIKHTVNRKRLHPRVSIIVSKKISKRAVERNRIRRRLYEQFRSFLPDIPEHTDIACIVTSKEVLKVEHQILTAVLSKDIQTFLSYQSD